MLTPIWTAKPELARKVRQRIRAALQWAMAHGHVDRNVAGEAIDGALPAMPAVAAHFRALPYGEVGRALEFIEAFRASLSAKPCLRFVALTACRSGEVRGAIWDEVDLDSREWRIPAARMKAEAEAPDSVALATSPSLAPLTGSGLRRCGLPGAQAARERGNHHDFSRSGVPAVAGADHVVVEDVAGFPAHAGMHRQDRNERRWRSGPPRTRGDEPWLDIQDLVDELETPARAGMH